MEVKGSDILQKNLVSLKGSLKEELPEFELALGYGSGVVPQEGYDYSKEMPLVDLLIVVEDVYAWHK